LHASAQQQRCERQGEEQFQSVGHVYSLS
jgi:hypothetical protein